MNTLSHLHATGEQMRKRWAAHQYDEKSFGSIATDVLKESKLHEKIRWEDILNEFIQGGPIDPLQVGSRFSDLQLIPYRHGRFYIEVLFWLTGSTTIHEHSFDGAFMVLEGESLAAEYTFNETRRINSKFLLGDITMRESEHLRQGDVRIIRPAGQFIHNVFHLAAPSVTIVLRTDDNPEVMPQYEYINPGIALETRNLCMDMIKRIQARSILAETQPDKLAGLWLDFIRDCSLDELYWTLRAVGGKWMPEEFKSQADAEIQKREGGALVQTALRNERRSAQIVSMRNVIVEPHQRYLLAALLMSDNRAGILPFLEYSGEPEQWLEAFVEIGKKRSNEWSEELFIGDPASSLFDPEYDAREVVGRLSPEEVTAVQNDSVFSVLLTDNNG